MFSLYSILLFVAPIVHYTVKVDAADTTAYAVEIRLQHVPAHFQLAMATHPEYDPGTGGARRFLTTGTPGLQNGLVETFWGAPLRFEKA